MDMSLQEFQNLLAIFWKQKYQPFTIDMTKEKYAGRYGLGLKSLFVPDSSSF